MDNRIEIRQDFYWNGDTMITEIVGRIAGDMEKKREESVLNHFETDYTELREFLEAKRKGMELVPLVRCRDCKWYKEGELLAPNKFCFRLMHPTENRHIGYYFSDNDFCSYGERKSNETY